MQLCGDWCSFHQNTFFLDILFFIFTFWVVNLCFPINIDLRLRKKLYKSIEKIQRFFYEILIAEPKSVLKISLIVHHGTYRPNRKAMVIFIH
jgi:hypothetical protein